MARYDETDLMLSEDFDLVINDKDDLALVHKQENVRQTARTYIKVSDPEWVDFDVKDIGANLEDLIGFPNTADTAREGIERITDSLTRYGLVERNDIYIRPVPISRYVITFFVFIKTPYDSQPMGFTLSFNLESGVTIRSA